MKREASSGRGYAGAGANASRRHGLIALLLAVALLLVPAGTVPGSAQTLPVLPVASGTSIFTAVQAPDLAPSTARDLGADMWKTTWAYADPRHFRIDVHVVSPALASQRMTIVANGSSLVWYQGLYRRAETLPVGNAPAWTLFAYFLGGTILGEAQALGLGAQATAGTQLAYLGQSQILRRTADAYAWGPLYSSSSNSCGTGQASCTSSSSSSGEARVYIDHTSRYVLSLTLLGSDPDTNGPLNWTYAVTTFSPGQAPSAAALAYKPPVPTRPAPTSTSAGSGASAGRGGWQVPKGFIPAGAPRGYMLRGSGSAEDTFWGKTSAVDANFAGGNGAFLYIQEQVRVSGLPAALRKGTEHQAGACTVWTGRYADGLTWLALARGHVSLLAASNRLTQRQLVRYARAHICH